MATKQDALAGAAPAIVTSDPWEELRRFTDARIGLGHCGVSLPVKRWLEFRLAHARARDAVMTPLDGEQVRAGLAAHGLECLSLSSAVADRNEYLTRPDKGRRLSVASRQLLDAWMDAHPGSAPDVSVVICDGLSARAVHENAVPFASRFLEEATAAGLSAAPVALVKFGRVAVGDDVAALLNARLVVVLVGERPGLSSPDSLGVYMTYAPAPGLTDEEIADALRPLEDANATRVVMHNMKAYPGDLHRFEGRADDTMLAAYSLNPQKNALAPEDVCAAMNLPFDADCPAASLLALADAQKEALARDGLTELYRTIEMPLMFVLRDMERAGFRVDADYLQKLGELYTQRLDETVERVRTLAGEAAQSVNLNSPKQLAKLLFEDLRIPAPGGKKNPGTSAEVLEELAADYPVCGLILEYRKYQKLNSTYVSALTRMRGADGRIHTSFEQAVTGTGRISSREPNLQNIPVRTELGREIRHAFVAEPGWQLVDADYSQIELRLLAHISGDEAMRAAFLSGEDVHRVTASQVFGVPLEDVTAEERRRAKAVNFGIVYGISAFSLAQDIGVSYGEAKEYMDAYFARFRGVRDYQKEAVRRAKALGYAETLFHRRRYLPELNVPALRAFGERVALNMPIQGTAADVIKLAMVHVDQRLRAEGMKAKLILQVHDELIVECPEAEREKAVQVLREEMEHAVAYTVPLTADAGWGRNWAEAHGT